MTPGGSLTALPPVNHNRTRAVWCCVIFLSIIVVIATSVSLAYDNLIECKSGPWNPASTCIKTPDGRQRCWFTHIPDSVKGMQSVPLVMVLHGYTACAEINNLYMHWSDVADANKFIVIQPQGTFNERGAIDQYPSWNADGCCAGSVELKVDDYGFLRSAIGKALESNPAIDKTRVYAAGHSNGCAMAQLMGYKASDVFAAVGCHSFYLVTDTTNYLTSGFKPTPIIEVHGKSDPTVSYTPVADEAGKPPAPPFEKIGAINNLHTWATLNGCVGDPLIVSNSTGSRTIDQYTTYTYSNCANGVQVKHVAIEGAGHLPFDQISQPLPGTDQPKLNIDTTTMVWNFLQQFSRKP